MRALITGITGQMGPWMAKYLLEQGFEVYGMMRRNASGIAARLDNLKFVLPDEWESVEIVMGDLTDSGSILNCLQISQPDLIFNYAAQSHVGESWKLPISTADITGLGPLRLLEAIRQFNPEIRLWQASSSEMFGNSPAPQNEETRMMPVSPYGIAKLFAHHSILNYRESYGMPICAGIQFNFESEIRGESFVTRKICKNAVEIYFGLREKIMLGNLDAKRDWSYGPDCIDAHFKMINNEQMTEYVIGSGETHSIREFAEIVFQKLSLDFDQYCEIDPKFLRPVELKLLQSDPRKIKRELGWHPRHSFKELVNKMVDAEIFRYEILG